MTKFIPGQYVRLAVGCDAVTAYRVAYHVAYLAAPTWAEKQAMKSSDHPYSYGAPGYRPNGDGSLCGVRQWQIGVFTQYCKESDLERPARRIAEVVFDGEAVRIDVDSLRAAETYIQPTIKSSVPVGCLVRLINGIDEFEFDTLSAAEVAAADDDKEWVCVTVYRDKELGLILNHTADDEYEIRVLFGEQLVYADCRILEPVK